MQKTPHNKLVTELDDFNKEIVCCSAQELCDQGKYTTCKKIKNFKERHWTSLTLKPSMTIIFLNLGFKYQTYHDCRIFVLERREVVAARAKFLRKMCSLRKEIYILNCPFTWMKLG